MKLNNKIMEDNHILCHFVDIHRNTHYILDAEMVLSTIQYYREIPSNYTNLSGNIIDVYIREDLLLNIDSKPQLKSKISGSVYTLLFESEYGEYLLLSLCWKDSKIVFIQDIKNYEPYYINKNINLLNGI